MCLATGSRFCHRERTTPPLMMQCRPETIGALSHGHPNFAIRQEAYNVAMPEEPELPDPTEVHELSETLADATERGDRLLISVSIIISALSIIGPLLLIESHRIQNTAAMSEAREAALWQMYMDKRDRQAAISQELDLLTILSPAAASEKTGKSDLERGDTAQKVIQSLHAQLEKLRQESEAYKEDAAKSEEVADRAGAKIDRITLGQGILQIGLLLSSITLYTRKRAFLATGLVFGAVGISVALIAVFFP